MSKIKDRKMLLILKKKIMKIARLKNIQNNRKTWREKIFNKTLIKKNKERE